MALTAATVEVDVALVGDARKVLALQHAVSIEIAHAQSGNGYHGDRVVNVAKAFEAYLSGNNEPEATPEATESEEARA
jgi:hypothetical protein